jgi:pimeloyl-ACP methyl ester carboxylesterase
MKLTGKLFTAGLVTGGTLGVLAVINKIFEARAGALDTVLLGEERLFAWKYGDVFYKVKGNREAKPLLLIHGFGPGTSSYEWRKNFESLSEQFQVYAIDLLGYGMSDRPVIDYTAETYVDLIGDFIREVIDKPTVVVAHGLVCAYVIAGAYRRPQLFERLVLVTPPATMLQETAPGPVNAVKKFVLRTSIIGRFIYNLLTTRSAIRAFYRRRGYHNAGLITDQLVERAHCSAHQAHSQTPAASLFSNYLNLDVHEDLARLQQRVVGVWGREGILVPPETAEAFRRVNPGIEIRILDNSDQLPQDEQAGQFNNLIREFAGQPVMQ